MIRRARIDFRGTAANAGSMLRVDDCVVLRRVSMGGGEENPEPPIETGSRRTSNGTYIGTHAGE